MKEVEASLTIKADSWDTASPAFLAPGLGRKQGEEGKGQRERRNKAGWEWSNPLNIITYIPYKGSFIVSGKRRAFQKLHRAFSSTKQRHLFLFIDSIGDLGVFREWWSTKKKLPPFLGKYKEIEEDIRYFYSLWVWSTWCFSENGHPLEQSILLRDHKTWLGGAGRKKLGPRPELQENPGGDTD